MTNIIIFHCYYILGASSDFAQATNIARAMVTKYAMSDKVKTVLRSITIGESMKNHGCMMGLANTQEVAFMIRVRGGKSDPPHLLVV